jgi:hypothetical protein
MRTIYFFIIAGFIFLSNCFAQLQKGQVGVSVSVQSPQLDFLIPVCLTENISFSPSIGISSISDHATDIAVGGILRYYFSNNIVSPFVGGRFGALILIPKTGDSISDIVFGPLFGGEYFLGPKLSLGIELQLNIIKSGKYSMRVGNPEGTNINTASALFATIYF